MVKSIKLANCGAAHTLKGALSGLAWGFVGVVGMFFIGMLGSSSGQVIVYSIGEPSSKEQLSLELINRARANPAAEGIRLRAQALGEVSVYSDCYSFGTNLTLMKAEMAAISPAPPLSFNENLINAARVHNTDMLASNLQTHYSGSDPRHYTNRMDNMGYVWSWAGENIFATSLNVSEAHASFEIDWGSGTGGMRNGRGHRAAIHSKNYREIGIGYLVASSANLGPSLITQNFGERISLSQMKPYITGVAIYDADGDSFYDIGEGIAGVRVEVLNLLSGQYEDHYAVTSNSGGYSVPLDGGAGDYRVEFKSPNGAVVSHTITVGSAVPPQSAPPNRKVDLILQEGDTPGYTPPLISGNTQIALGSTRTVDFPDLAGALDYEVLIAEIVAFPTEQDADASAAVSTNKSTAYSLVGVPLNQGDRLAFHLAHPGPTAGGQSMILERAFVPAADAVINFDSRLRRCGTAQIAVLQVTADWGRTWEDVWFHQTNISNVNEFSPVAVDVSKFEGQPIKFRFTFYLGGGTVEYGALSSHGWHFDDIGFTGMSELVGASSSRVTESEYQFTPPAAGEHHVQVRARAGEEFLRYATATDFEVTSGGYSEWAIRHELAAGLAAGTLADSTSDYDGDGLSQLIEYALEGAGFDPASADSTNVLGAEIDAGALVVRYTVDTSLTDVSVAVEVSTDLKTWYLPGAPGAPAGFIDTQDGAPAGSLQARVAQIPSGNHESLFVRLLVVDVSSP